jgi:phage terminase large subunit-like protein
VGSMRINRLDYVRVGDGVETLAKHFRVRRIRMDTTGVGEAVSDMLKKRGLNIIDFTFTNKSKERLVSTVVREIEHKRLVLPKEDTQLLRELKAFARTVSKAGNVIYSAPANAHDDTVMALGLAAIECGLSVQARVSNYVYGEAA